MHTNGYWADDPARAQQWCTDLAGAGLGTMVLSSDQWHLDHIPLASVIAAAEAAANAGIAVEVMVPAARSDWIAMRIVAELRERTSALVSTHPAHPIGRGEDLPPGTLQQPAFGFGGCDVIGHLEVDADGTVAVSPASADFGEASPLGLGSVDRDHVGDLIDRYRRTPLFAVIATAGPLAVHALLEGRPDVTGHGLGPRPHACLLCRSVHRSSGPLRELTERTGLDLLTPVGPDRFRRILGEALRAVDAALATPVTVGSP